MSSVKDTKDFSDPARVNNMSFEEPSSLRVYLGLLAGRILFGSYYKGYIQGLGLMGNEWVIDYGSGTGEASKHIARTLLRGGGHLTCVDISDALMKVTRKRLATYTNVDFKLGDISELDIPDDHYDLVVIHFVLHDIPKGQRQEKVEALSKKLKRTGRIFINEPVDKDNKSLPEEIRHIMASAGLREISFESDRSTLLGRACQGVFEKT